METLERRRQAGQRLTEAERAELLELKRGNGSRAASLAAKDAASRAGRGPPLTPGEHQELYQLRTGVGGQRAADLASKQMTVGLDTLETEEFVELVSGH
jgi:hypothetical protein